MSIHSLIPDAERVLALDPEELADVLMQYLNALPAREQEHLNRYNFGLTPPVQGYPEERQEEI